MLEFTKENLKLYKKFESSLNSYPEYFFCNASKLLNYCSIFSQNESLSRKKSFLFSLTFFLANLFLFIISIFTIIKCKFKKIDIAHYLLDVSPIYDHRSHYILKIVKPSNSINFFHIGNITLSIKTFHKKDNPIYFESIFYILNYFIKADDSLITFKKNIEQNDKILFEKIINFYKKDVNTSSKKIKLFIFLLNFLGIKRFIMLEDSRNTNELILASKKLKIKTIGYMHGRFNEYHVGLFYYNFDKYIMWNNYFKKLMLKFNKNYRRSDIVISGHPKISKIPPSSKRKKSEIIKVLILGETNPYYDEIFKYIEQLVKDKNIKLYFRGKPNGLGSTIDFYFKKHNIELMNSSDLFKSLLRNEIDVVVGTCSTVLIETIIVEIPSLYLQNSYGYPFHMVEDKLVSYCKSPSIVINEVYKLKNISKKEIEIFKKRTWGKKILCDNNLIKETILSS